MPQKSYPSLDEVEFALEVDCDLLCAVRAPDDAELAAAATGLGDCV
jgi:hypothetical protein